MRKVARFIMFAGQLRGMHASLSAEQTSLPALQTIVILLIKQYQAEQAAEANEARPLALHVEAGIGRQAHFSLPK